MDHPVLARQQFDECAEVRSPHDLASVDLPNLYFLGQIPDHLFRPLGRISVARPNDDRTVVLDIDCGPCLVDNAADHLPTGADHGAYFVDRYLYGLHPRRVFAHLAAIRGYRAFDVFEDLLSGVPGLMQGVVYHIVAYTLDLHVELDGSNSIYCSGDLEVHVAHVVFFALDVGECDVLPSLTGYQTY